MDACSSTSFELVSAHTLSFLSVFRSISVSFLVFSLDFSVGCCCIRLILVIKAHFGLNIQPLKLSYLPCNFAIHSPQLQFYTKSQVNEAVEVHQKPPRVVYVC